MRTMAKHVVRTVVVPLSNFVATISVTLRGMFVVTMSTSVVREPTAVILVVVVHSHELRLCNYRICMQNELAGRSMRSMRN